MQREPDVSDPEPTFEMTPGQEALHDPGCMENAARANGTMPEPQRIARGLRAVFATYTPEGVGIWLYGTKRSLGCSPIELLEQGRVDRFEEACLALLGMVAT